MTSSLPKIKPLIKWIGGKYDEFEKFKAYIPSFKNYYEPFFGGGGVFFALQPKGKCYLNDLSHDLIQFYKEVPNPGFHNVLRKYVEAWEQVGLLAKDVGRKLLPFVTGYVAAKATNTIATDEILKVLSTIPYELYHPLFQSSFIINKPLFLQHLHQALHDKCKRLKIMAIREKGFQKDNILHQIETAVHAGFYTHVRDLHNQYATKSSFHN